ncbi:MAG: hypothetical protein KAR21_09295, partial [Spirochaetales bacterium]|nr:hypothetical protein [Spirochaetales bacterium]
MPTLDDLNDIKHKLLNIGDEPGILAAKGEVPVDIGPPDTGLSEDLSALFDDFSDVDEEKKPVPDSSVPEPAEGGPDDFYFDLDYDEPVLDMDGFDAPEDAVLGGGTGEDILPDISGIDEEPVLDEIDLEQFSDDSLSGDLASSIPDAPDSLVPEPAEGGFAEELGLSDEDLDFGSITDDSVPDDLVPEPAEGGFAEELGLSDEDIDFGSITDDSVPESVEGGFAEELGISDEDLDLGEVEPGPVPQDSPPETIEEDFSAEELDLSVEEDIDFGDSVPESLEDDFSAKELDLSVEDEGLDFDLSGGDSGFDDIDSSDDFGLPGDEIASGDDEELSFDDSDADDLDLGEFEIGDESFDEELEIDEFDLGDLGQDFGVLEEDLSAIPEESIAPADSSGVDSDLEEEEFEIDEETFKKVKASLLNLPRNLKLIIEEEIGEKGLKGPSLEKLINALAEGKTPKEIAVITSKITGKKIKIPANYARRTGLDFEEEKGSFQYTLIHNILPLVKIFAISTIAIAALSFISYKFIYRP